MREPYKLPLKKKVLYSIGEFGEFIPTYFISSYIFIFYAPASGHVIIPSYIIGIIFFLGTAIQAIANPFVGSWSDKSHSKLGRRRFFIITGFIPMTLSFYLMWIPTSHFILNIISLLAYMLFFNFLFAYVITPYLALIPEISINSNDRVRLTTIAAYFSIIGIIISSLIPAILFSLGLSMAFVAGVMSMITVIALLSVILSIKESTNVSMIPNKYTFIQGIQQTFRNKTFKKYIFAYLSFEFGFSFFLSSLGYYIEDVVFKPSNTEYTSYIGIFTFVAVFSAILFSPLLVRYSDKKGEKNSFILFTILLSIPLFLTFFVGLYSEISNVIQMLILMVFAGIGLTSFFILPNAILSEIIDEDELITGFRREGMYFGVQGFLEHFSISFASLVLGFWISGFYTPTHNILFIRLLGVIAGIFVLLTAIMFYFVPLKQNILSNIKK